MNYKQFSKYFFALFVVSMIGSAMAVTTTPLSVDQPDGTDDSVSGYYTIEWTPESDTAEPSLAMQDGNTISCYTDGDNSGYEVATTIMSNYPCCDANEYTFNIYGWEGRNDDLDYYVWCKWDQNTDVNAYSSGPLTVTRFKAADFAGMSFDTVGGMMNAIAVNIGGVALLIVISIIIVLILDAVTGVFGIFDYIRGRTG